MSGVFGESISSGDLQEGGLETFTSLDTGAFKLQRQFDEDSNTFGKFTLFDDPFQILSPAEQNLTSRVSDLGTTGGEAVRGLTSDLRGQVGESLDTSRGLLSESSALRGDLEDLAAEVSPGFGSLTKSARETVRNAAQREAGNLRSQFSRRDLSGSAFDINEQRRLALDFAVEEEEAVAEATIQEIELQQSIFQDIANLLLLDTQTLGEQAQLLAVSLGATELEAQSFEFELAALQEEANILTEATQRELTELSVGLNFINGVSSSVNTLAAAEAAVDASIFGTSVAAGTSLATLGTSSLTGETSDIITGTTPGGLPITS